MKDFPHSLSMQYLSPGGCSDVGGFLVFAIEAGSHLS